MMATMFSHLHHSGGAMVSSNDLGVPARGPAHPGCLPMPTSGGGGNLVIKEESFGDAHSVLHSQLSHGLTGHHHHHHHHPASVMRSSANSWMQGTMLEQASK